MAKQHFQHLIHMNLNFNQCRYKTLLQEVPWSSAKFVFVFR